MVTGFRLCKLKFLRFEYSIDVLITWITHQPVFLKSEKS